VLGAIERVCASGQFILGPEVEALEREIAAFTGAEAAVGCSSGTEALWLALTAAGVGPGDEVMTTAFSFFASASAIVRTGARPVFVDVDPGTLNIDPEQLEFRLRGHADKRGPAASSSEARPPCSPPSPHSSHPVRALLPVHLYGQCADMDAIGRIAENFGVLVIEDAAQAIGAAWRNRRAGCLGKGATFSFYPTKNLSAYGDAGIVTTTDADWAEHMRRLRNHGSPRRYVHEEFGWNGRLDAIQAAVLRVKLPFVETWNRARRERAAEYDRLLTQAGLISPTGHSPVRTLRTSPHAFHVYHQYVIRAERRDDLRQFLASRQIGSEVYYPIPLHLQPCLAYLGYAKGDLPESERSAEEVLALPMFPELTAEEQQVVVEAIAEFYS
jgi:dTDP-4-amino-4,6-dideoxygalactose transaminase